METLNSNWNHAPVFETDSSVIIQFAEVITFFFAGWLGIQKKIPSLSRRFNSYFLLYQNYNRNLRMLYINTTHIDVYIRNYMLIYSVYTTQISLVKWENKNLPKMSSFIVYPFPRMRKLIRNVNGISGNFQVWCWSFSSVEHE